MSWATSWRAAACSSSGSLERVRRVELTLGVEPSHYEPASDPESSSATTGAQAGPAPGTDAERPSEAQQPVAR